MGQGIGVGAKRNGKTMKALVKLGQRPDDCWTWLGAIDDNGYPRKEFHGQSEIASRWLWQQLFGPLPPGIVVAFTCGNRGCMNPHHLRATSQAEACREGAGAVLTPQDVADIKRVPKDERTPNAVTTLAQRCGCSRALIYDIWGGRAHNKARANPRRLAPRQNGWSEAGVPA